MVVLGTPKPLAAVVVGLKLNVVVVPKPPDEEKVLATSLLAVEGENIFLVTSLVVVNKSLDVVGIAADEENKVLDFVTALNVNGLAAVVLKAIVEVAVTGAVLKPKPEDVLVVALGVVVAALLKPKLEDELVVVLGAVATALLKAKPEDELVVLATVVVTLLKAKPEDGLVALVTVFNVNGEDVVLLMFWEVVGFTILNEEIGAARLDGNAKL